MKTAGTIELEILRNRTALKTWIVKRIALTAVVSDEENEASDWFHGLRYADRSRMIVDLARSGIEGVDLAGIAEGPLGDLLRRYPSLFQLAETTPVRPLRRQKVREEMPELELVSTEA